MMFKVSKTLTVLFFLAVVIVAYLVPGPFLNLRFVVVFAVTLEVLVLGLVVELTSVTFMLVLLLSVHSRPL